MAEISFSIPDLFAAAFGYRSPAFQPDFNPVPVRKEISDTGANYYANDAQGREYFMPVTITYSPNIALPDGSTTGGPTVMLNLAYPVISANARKSVIATELEEIPGTFKELISRGDWDITIRGLMISQTNDFPEADFKALIDLWHQDTAVSIKSALTDMLLIHTDRKASDNVVIVNIDFPSMTGVKHVKAYEIKMISDFPFNLNVIS